MKDPYIDLKKFITQNTLQSEERLRKEFTDKLETLQVEMRESFTAVGESFEELTLTREEDRQYIDKVFSTYARETSIMQKQIARLKNLSGVRL